MDFEWQTMAEKDEKSQIKVPKKTAYIPENDKSSHIVFY